MVGFLVSVGFGDSDDWVLGEIVGEAVGVELCVTLRVGEAEGTCSIGWSGELKIDPSQIIAINPPMADSDPRFSLTSINLREAKAFFS